MTDSYSSKEFRFKRSSNILGYLRNFSATEKALFGLLVTIMLVTTLTMFAQANSYFLTEIPAQGGTLHEGIIGLPRNINPVLALTDTDQDLSTLIYAGLMKYADGKLVPDIAQSYTISEDGLTYTFTLKDKVRFQDGALLTADDVIFTIQKIQETNLRSPRGPDWTNVTVRKISDNQVSFALKQPYAPFLANTTIGIIPKHIWSKLTDNEFILNKHNLEAIGAGPYKISDFVENSKSIPSEYTLVTWNGYHDKKPFIHTIVFHFFSDEDSAVEALEDGSIDSLPTISAQSAAKLSVDTNSEFTIISEPLPRIFGVFFNQNHNSVLADKVVRKALEMSVDRQAIVDSVLFGYGTPITSPLPFGITGSSTNYTKTTATSTRIIEAMDYIEDNGWKKNESGIYEKKTKTSTQKLSFTLYTADTPDLKQTADILKNYWQQFGAEVDIKIFEANDLYQNIIKTRKYDALLFGEQIGKDKDLYAFWHSSQRNAPGLNVAMYTNSKIDKLLEDIRTTTDSALQKQKYTELETIIHDDIPAIFLYSPDFIYTIPKKLQGVDLGTITTPSDRWNSIDSWYIVTEKVWKWFAQDITK